MCSSLERKMWVRNMLYLSPREVLGDWIQSASVLVVSLILSPVPDLPNAVQPFLTMLGFAHTVLSTCNALHYLSCVENS
jgi:hypothetical protein